MRFVDPVTEKLLKSYGKVIVCALFTPQNQQSQIEKKKKKKEENTKRGRWAGLNQP